MSGALAAPYAMRLVALSTMHRKEKAIAPAFRQTLGSLVLAIPGINTDELGTFTGEIPRTGTMEETVRKKARLGMRASGLRLGIASEGSFGPHPAIPFFPAGLELMIFIDDERGFEIIESQMSEETNYTGVLVKTLAEAEEFLKRSRFPSHKTIVASQYPRGKSFLAKGIGEKYQLIQAVKAAAKASKNGIVRIETDMRAHMNPTRMRCIRSLAAKLAKRLNTPCPKCEAPGWGVTDVEKGLPCRSCHTPTHWTARLIFSCALCGYRRVTGRPDGKNYADEALCPYCNP